MRRRVRFPELMRHRVNRILLVSSLYDSFILAEDGQLAQTFYTHFSELDLHGRPDLARVSTGAEALDFLEDGDVDLIVTRMYVGDMDALELSRRVVDSGIDKPLLLLAYSNEELAYYREHRHGGAIERAFMWQGTASVVLAMVKYVEDRLNAPFDVAEAGVPAIIVVENSVRFTSSFLPVIFIEVLKHMRSIMAEGLNLYQQLTRLRARPKILLADSYEEGWSCFTRYEEHVLGVISDVRFPRGGDLDPKAGVALTTAMRERVPSLPVMLQSSIPDNEALAHSHDMDFLLKGSPTLLRQLRRFIVSNFGFGEFRFKLPDGTRVGVARSLRELDAVLREVPSESVAWHAERNHFSTWFKARAEFELAERLRPRRLDEFPHVDALRGHLLAELEAHHARRARTVVADFDRSHGSPYVMARMGGGSLGGKARGLAFANRLLAEHRIDQKYPQVQIAVPSFVVLGTDIFDQFLADNGLLEYVAHASSDEDIRQRFMDAQFPEEARLDLQAFLESATWPLAVRSSGLLEDSASQPLAGIYDTFMLPNDHPDARVRLTQLISAIKKVYSSTWSEQTRSFLSMTAYRLEEEKMAVIIQQLVGSRHGDRFYPTLSGVARTWNYYPKPPQEAEDGVVAVALGLGPGVVEGGRALRFSPRHPRHVMGWVDVDHAIQNSQRDFFAMRMSGGGMSMQLERCDLEVAEADGTLGAVGSTWSIDNDIIYDNLARPGVRLVTFAPILKHRLFPLAPIIDDLLRLGAAGTSSPVEIEFAVEIPETGTAQLAFLQLRPIIPQFESHALEIGEVPEEAMLCRSSVVLGNGRTQEIRDVVAVDPDAFDRLDSQSTAEHVTQLNHALQAAGAPYLLIGVGRWGTADPFLGIPVTWGQVSGARVIIEAGLPDMEVAPSQGSHFFQNLISAGVGYFTVNATSGFLDWPWLEDQEEVQRLGCVRHLRVASPLTVLINGRAGVGLILKPDAAALAGAPGNGGPLAAV